MYSNHFKHNLIKNVSIIILAIVLYPLFLKSIQPIQVEQMGNFLLIISILLVTVSFPAFAFTYEKSKLDTFTGKFLSHGATFIFMLLIALLLEIMVIAVQVVYPSFYLIVFILALLIYIGVILYDFWDFFRLGQ